MIIIRYGTYTIYNGIEMPIIEYYGHGLDQETTENHRYITCPKECGQMEGFFYDTLSDKYKKDVLIKDLTNAFFVVTKASYKGEVFEVQPYFGDDVHIHLITRSREVGKRYKFYKFQDGVGKPYYLGEVTNLDIEKLWEERTTTKYNLPMPQGVEFYKEIPI